VVDAPSPVLALVYGGGGGDGRHVVVAHNLGPAPERLPLDGLGPLRSVSPGPGRPTDPLVLEGGESAWLVSAPERSAH